LDAAVINNTVDAKGAYDGIWFSNSDRTRATGNSVANATIGVHVGGCNSTAIINNYLSSVEVGIYTVQVKDCYIERNTINASSAGFLTLFLDNFTACDNTILSALTGFDLVNVSNKQSSMIHITGNYFRNVTNVTRINGFDDFTELGLFMHDNYCNGDLFNGTVASCVSPTSITKNGDAITAFFLPIITLVIAGRRMRRRKKITDKQCNT